MPESPPEPRPVRPRRRFGLSLRALMVMVLVLGGTLGWVAYEARVQKDAVEAIERSGGSAHYDWEFGPDGFLARGAKPRPRAPEWLVKGLGVDVFGHVHGANVGTKGTDEDMRQVGRLRGLVVLQVSGREVTDAGMAHLAGLTRLERLVVDRKTKITGASTASMGRMSRMKYLFLPKAVTDADFAHLAGLTRLETLLLQVAPSPRLTDAGLANLAGMPELKTLMLNAPAVTSAGLGHFGRLSKLQMLALDGSRVGSLEPLRPLTALVDLRLGKTDVDDAGLALLASNRRLVFLDLSDSKVTDSGLAVLRGQARLTGVHVDGTRITDDGLEAISGLTGLQTLGFARSAVTDAGLSKVSGLTSLLFLDLTDTKITDAGLSKIAGMTKLSSLDLAGTRITDAGLAHLAKLPLNRELNLGNTAVTDAGIVAHLGKKATLNIVDLRGTAVGKAGLAALRLNGVKAMTGPMPRPVVAANGPK